MLETTALLYEKKDILVKSNGNCSSEKVSCNRTLIEVVIYNLLVAICNVSKPKYTVFFDICVAEQDPQLQKSKSCLLLNKDPAERASD